MNANMIALAAPECVANERECYSGAVALALMMNPLPEGCAYVEITEPGDGTLKVGDVARVDLTVDRYLADAAYAVRIDDSERIRRIQGRREGLQVFWGNAREPFDPARMEILGVVDARISWEAFT